MTTLALDLQPNADLTLNDAVFGLLVYLEPTTLIVPQKREVPIAVFTGIMAPLAPLIFLRLWRNGTLWFFRIRRKKGSGTSIVAHPLNICALWLSLTGLLVLTSVCLRYRYGEAATMGPLRAHMAVVLASWVTAPIGPIYTILGTASTLSDPAQPSVSWFGKAESVLCGTTALNGATVAAPLLWLGCILPFVILAQVHFAKCLEGLEALQAAQSAASEVSTSAMTMAQLLIFVQAWGHLRQCIWSLAMTALLWAILVGFVVLTLGAVGLRVLFLLYGRLRALNGSSWTAHSTLNLEGKRRYIRQSMAVLGGFYFMIALSGTIVVVIMAIAAHELLDTKGSVALKWFKLGNLTFQWIAAVCGLGVMLFVSSRVHAALNAEAVSQRLSAVTTRSATSRKYTGESIAGLLPAAPAEPHV